MTFLRWMYKPWYMRVSGILMLLVWGYVLYLRGAWLLTYDAMLWKVRHHQPHGHPERG